LIPCTVKELIFGEEKISLILIALYSKSFDMPNDIDVRKDGHASHTKLKVSSSRSY
jgi:hypothetical protein